jgi:GDP-L-fucose synthase
MQKQDKIFIAGGTGMVGSAIIRTLQQNGYTNLLANYYSRQPQDDSLQWVQLNLANQAAVQTFFARHNPDHVFLAAAKVGGIHANNTYPAEFIFQNMMIEANVIHAAHKFDVKRLLFLGSSCIYPREAPQPMKEEALLTGPLEPTNEPYAVAKIAGIKLCESYNRQYGRDFRSVMPTNLYGPGDNYDLENSHVIPALIRKMHLGKCLEQNDLESLRADLNARPIGSIDDTSPDDAILGALKEHGIFSLLTSDHRPLTSVSIWGSGTPKREFLHIDDMASACVHVMNLDQKTYKTHTQSMLSHINVGAGTDCTIKELAETIAKVVGFKGRLEFDSTKPDGTPRKLLDVSRLESLGWKAETSFESGLKSTYSHFLAC